MWITKIHTPLSKTGAAAHSNLETPRLTVRERIQADHHVPYISPGQSIRPQIPDLEIHSQVISVREQLIVIIVE